MGKLIKEWVKGILTEGIEKKVVVYAGRFQPFHKGHNATYEHLVKQFGRDNVYIGTSNKTDNIKSPFKFNEKKMIMTKMFGISSNKIVQIKNPYAPTEIIGKFNKETTAFITVVGEKDRYRLKGKYFEPYHPDRVESGYKDKGYVYVAPAQSNPISGTEVRKLLSFGNDDSKKKGFKKAYDGKFNPKIYKFVTDKLGTISTKMESFLSTFDFNKIISEASATQQNKGTVDDGPGAYYGNSKTYKKVGEDVAQMLGWQVVDYILGSDEDSIYADDERILGDKYPVSYFPSGKPGLDGQIRYTDLKGNPAYKTWAKHITKVATMVGYTLVDFLDAEKAADSSKNEPKKVSDPNNTTDVETEKFKELKESLITEGGAYVVCRECNKQMKQIQYRHLKYSHDMTLDEYKAKHPNVPLVCEDVKNIGDKNPMKNDVVRKKHKTTMSSKSHKNLMSEVMIGKNLGNIRDDLKARNKTKEHRDAVSKGVKKSYIKNSNLRKERSKVGNQYGFGNKETQKKIGDVLNWTPIHKKDKFSVYTETVRRLTNEEYQKYFELIPNAKKRSREYHLDHKYSISDGFRNNIPAQVISHYKNFEIKHHSINESKGANSNIKLPQLLKDIMHSNHKIDKRILLTCGGAYGHMNHPFDIKMNLTFGDLKQIIKGALNGKLELAREKTDGQALAVSWRDDKGLIAARNKGHLKNKGENALDISAMASKFGGRGGLTDAYNFAMRDLNDAIKSLSSAQRDKIFKQGSSFMNLEVIWPTSVNVVPYGQALLVFHNTGEFNDDGIQIGANTDAAKILAGMIKQINKNVTDKYTIQGPPVTQLPKNQELSKMQSKFDSQLKKVQSEFKLKDSDGVADYHQAWWEQWVDSNSPSTLDNKTKMGLVKRWAFDDKSFRLDKKNITDSDTLEWSKKIDKKDHTKLAKENTRKFEDIFLGVGAEVLSFMSSVLTVNPDKAVRDMKKRLDQTIKDVSKSGSPEKITKLKMELERLAAIGGKDKIVPNEGLVFVFKGDTYKLTGAFASLNQILGLMYF